MNRLRTPGRVRTCLVAMVVVGETMLSRPAPARSESATASPETVADAKEHFRLGIALYDEGDAAGALVELTRAYELVSTFKILYNLGQVAYQLHDYAGALGYFRRYLADGEGAIPAERRSEVETEIGILKKRTGHIRVDLSEPGASIVVDDLTVGTSPLRSAIQVNVGRHRVTAISRSGERRAQVVDLAGEEVAHVRFTFRGLALDPPPPPPSRSTPKTPTLFPRAVSARTSLWDARPLPPHHTPEAKAAGRGVGLAWLWTLTAASAAGAAISGALALTRSHQIRSSLDSYPVAQDQLEDLRSEQRTYARVGDGLLIGSLLLAGVSLYLTASSPSTAASPPSRRTDFARSDL